MNTPPRHTPRHLPAYVRQIPESGFLLSLTYDEAQAHINTLCADAHLYDDADQQAIGHAVQALLNQQVFCRAAAGEVTLLELTLLA